jgi:tRNA nucleotidyltransferase (CCA-adding enzyme)
VFLHPLTKDEVALARTERKTAPGYHGFSFSADASVTLEDDLSRRDLTINAMAQDAQGVITDPFGGQRDLALKLLRHVSPAFAEDPVRILRLARFAARLNDFTVAPETTALMRQMVEAGEVDALVSERVWQELSRGLMEKQPSRMFEVLRSCGALAKLLPEVDRLWGVPQRADYHPSQHTNDDTGVHLMMVLDMSARLNAPLTVRFACLGHGLGKGATPADVLPRHLGHEERSVQLVASLSERLRVPTDCRSLAEVVAREHGNIHRSASLSAAALVRLLERCDALRRPQRWDEVLMACECDARGRLGLGEQPYPQRPRLNQVRDWASDIDSAAVAEQAALRGMKGPAIGDAVHAARVAAVLANAAS